jgi:hypothetical protein
VFTSIARDNITLLRSSSSIYAGVWICTNVSSSVQSLSTLCSIITFFKRLSFELLYFHARAVRSGRL